MIAPHRLIDQRAMQDALSAYVLAKKPTSQLLLNLCDAFAQMTANDCEVRVSVTVDGISVVRQPIVRPGQAS